MINICYFNYLKLIFTLGFLYERVNLFYVFFNVIISIVLCVIFLILAYFFNKRYGLNFLCITILLTVINFLILSILMPLTRDLKGNPEDYSSKINDYIEKAEIPEIIYSIHLNYPKILMILVLFIIVSTCLNLFIIKKFSRLNINFKNSNSEKKVNEYVVMLEMVVTVLTTVSSVILIYSKLKNDGSAEFNQIMWMYFTILYFLPILTSLKIIESQIKYLKHSMKLQNKND